MSVYEIELTTGSNELDTLHLWFDAMKGSVNAQDMIRIKTVVHEIVTNCIQHAYKNKADKIILIQAYLNKNIIQVEVKDWGCQFTDICDERFKEQEFPENGMGLYAAQRASDALSYRRSEAGENYWNIEFKRIIT